MELPAFLNIWMAPSRGDEGERSYRRRPTTSAGRGMPVGHTT
jgi:hypothetical protein